MVLMKWVEMRIVSYGPFSQHEKRCVIIVTN
jgi:hypothetical protein